MSQFLVDVREHGAKGDGITDDSEAFARAAKHARATDGRLVAAGKFRITKNIDIYTNTDLSQATIVVDGGSFSIREHSTDRKQVVLDSAAGDFVVHKLTYLNTTLADVLSKDILAEYANSFVLIESDDVYIVRRQSDGSTAEQKKSTVSHMGDFGRLSYSLTHGYTSSSGVKLMLRKLPPRRLRFDAPAFVIQRMTTTTALLNVMRDLVDVVGFTYIDRLRGDGYYCLTRCVSCYDVTFRGAAFPGYGVTGTEPGASPDVRYDFIFDRALRLRFDSIHAGTGWKTIDGNSSRDIAVTGSVIDSFEGHFNVSDVLVDNCHIVNRGLSFGTGSADSSITVRNCVFLTRSRSPLSMRADYGELRGSYVIDNCIFNLRSSAPAGKITILSLQDATIKDQDQPTWYSLPRRIVIRDIAIRTASDCGLVAFNDHRSEYGPKRRLAPPAQIRIDGVDAREVLGALSFDYDFIPFEADASARTDIDLANVRVRPASGFHVTLGAQAATQDQLHYRARLSGCDNVRASLMGSRRSEAHIADCTMTRLKTYAAGGSRLKVLAVARSTFTYDGTVDPSHDFVFEPSVQRMSVTGCTIDASAYRRIHGKPLLLSATAHHAADNLAVDCHGSSEVAPVGRVRIVPSLGDPLSYSLGDGDSMKPT